MTEPRMFLARCWLFKISKRKSSPHRRHTQPLIQRSWPLPRSSAVRKGGTLPQNWSVAHGSGAVPRSSSVQSGSERSRWPVDTMSAGISISYCNSYGDARRQNVSRGDSSRREQYSHSTVISHHSTFCIFFRCRKPRVMRLRQPRRLLAARKVAVDHAVPVAVAVAVLRGKRPATTVDSQDTLPETVLTTAWRARTGRLSTRRVRSTVVASTAVRWDTSARIVRSRRETRLVTTVARMGTSRVTAPTPDRLSKPSRGVFLYYLVALC